MNVFWRFGYEHTSLDGLMREMRIARQSLYDTFGDKRALYLKALRQYRDNDHLRLRRLFASGQSVKDGFATILFGISSESREEHERGCLLLSANMERAAIAKVIGEFLLDNQLKTEAIFTDALRRAGDGQAQFEPTSVFHVLDRRLRRGYRRRANRERSRPPSASDRNPAPRCRLHLGMIKDPV